MDEPTNSQLGISSHIVGELRSEADVVIDGYFEGIAHTSGKLTVGAVGKVSGDIYAADVLVEGKITGDVHASGQLEIGPAGVLLGDIRAAGLTIRDGGTFRGQVIMDRDEDPDLPPPPPIRGDGAMEEAAVEIPSLGDEDPPPAWDTDEHRQADVRARMASAYDRDLSVEIPSQDPDRTSHGDEADLPPRRSIEQLHIAGDTTGHGKDPLGVGSDE